MSQEPSSEAEALALLERASRLAAGRATREAVSLLDRDVDDGDAHASADEQNELAWALVAWAERLEREVRAREAHTFYAAAVSLPKGPREDPELLAATLRSARTLGLEREAARYRAALLSGAPARGAQSPRGAR